MTIPAEGDRVGRFLNLSLRDRAPVILGLAAAIIYATGIWWGLPHATSEVTIRGWDIDSIAGMGPLAELHNLLIQPQPGWYFAYPLFHYLVLGAAYAPYVGYLLLTGGLASPAPDYPYGFADPVGAIATLALIGRIIAVAMGTGVVLGVYFAARRVWGRPTAVIAALGMMLCGPLVYYAQAGNLDVPVLFWQAMCLVVLAAIVTGGLTTRRAVVFGLLAAVAVATKDQAYGALVPAVLFVMVAHFIDAGREGPRPAGWWKPVAALVGAGIAGYAVANGIVFRPSRFINHVRFLLDFEQTFQNVVHLNVVRPATVGGYLQVASDVSQAVLDAMGPLFLLAALGGIAATWRKGRFTKLLIAMLVGYLLLVIAPIRHFQYRWAMFAVMTLILPAARLLSLGLETGGWKRVTARTVTVLAVVWLAVKAVDLKYQILFDARNAAGAWLADHLRPGDRVAYFGSVGQLPRIPAGVDVIRIETDSLSSTHVRDSGARYVLVIPDYSSPRDVERSLYLPLPTYEALQDGSLGYRRVARFDTRPLLGRRMKYLPIINPPVQVFGKPTD